VSIDSALIAQDARIPATAAVADAIRSYGHEAVFSDGFEFAVRDGGLWRTVSIDGEQAGFDYVVSELANWEDDDEITFPRNVGDTLLEFGARGNVSIKLVAYVQRAICELSDAYGWIDQELIPPSEMISDCKNTAENWDEIAAKLDADWAAMPTPLPAASPSPLTIAERGKKWLEEGGWYTLLGWGIGALIVTYLVIVK